MPFIGNLRTAHKLLVVLGAFAMPATALIALAGGGPAEASSAWLIAAGVGLVLAGLVSVALVAAAGRDLAELGGLLAQMATGDFSRGIASARRDEFGDLLGSLRALQVRVTGVVEEIERSGERVADAAQRVGRAADELGARTERQAAALEETAASMEEITAAMKNNAGHADSSTAIALTTRTQAERGGAIAREAIAAMSGLRASSRKIVDIVGVVDDIAFQTNLLALNAAVEAARAGDAGRGFAVVAGDVRNLAQRSATAAREIKELIKDSNGRVDGSGRLVGDTGRHLDEIVGSVKEVADLIEQMCLANREQAVGVEEISRAVTDLDSSTQQNAGLVEGTSAAAQAMRAEAAQLATLVHRFRLPGHTAPDPRTAPGVRAAPHATPGRPAAPRRAARPMPSHAPPPRAAPNRATPPPSAAAPASTPSPVPATAPRVERRSKDRPWSNRTAAPAGAALARTPAASRPDARVSEEWTEF